MSIQLFFTVDPHLVCAGDIQWEVREYGNDMIFRIGFNLPENLARLVMPIVEINQEFAVDGRFNRIQSLSSIFPKPDICAFDY